MSYWNQKRVAVIGGAGFIGSYLTEALLERAADVLVIDNLESGHRENLAAVWARIRFIEGDAADLAFTRGCLAGCDVVMNLAAQAPGVGHSHLHHVELLGRNLQVGSVILEAAKQAGVRRALVVSSSCVYPDDAPVPTPELPLFMGEPERVNAGYGWAKRYLEAQAEYYAKQFGMEIAVGRPFNAYGGRDLGHGERAHVIPALIRRLFSDQPELVVWGSGRQTRSFIHARDVALGLLLLTERYAVCDAVNIGHDHETSMAELATLLMEISGVQKQLVFDTTKPEGAARKCADMTKFRRVTGGFAPQTNIRNGLREMLDAHRKAMGT